MNVGGALSGDSLAWSPVGIIVGVRVGEPELGLFVGSRDGSSVGIAVGCGDGSMVGYRVGSKVVGVSVGCMEGCGVVGAVVGLRDGSTEGCGALDGAGVGRGVSLTPKA